MSRAVGATGTVLVAMGLAIFALKAVGYGVPLAPAETPGPWQLELRIRVRGDGTQGSVRALLPASGTGQQVFDERASSDRLAFSIRDKGEDRLGVWTGWLESIHEIVYEFRVQTYGFAVPLPAAEAAPPPPSVRERWARPTSRYPASAPEVRALLRDLGVPAPGDVAGRVRTLYAFVAHEVATVSTAGPDALLTLSEREGSAEGKARLLATLLRAAGVPARNVQGLELRAGTSPETRTWTEAWVDGRWVPMSATLGFFATRPPDFLALGREGRPLVEATGVRAVGHRYRSLREPLRPAEIASMLAPENPLLARLSLYRLPVGSQAALRTLLLLPLGALVVALFRNVVGIPTYGTFMPVLIALAIRGFGLLYGLALVAFVIAVGVAGRLPLERLRLLLVPRLALLLCLVVLTVTALALVGRDLGIGELFAGVLFPIVILTMLVERLSITIAEEGLREALLKAVSSVLVAVAIYPAFRSLHAEYLMFSFPELLVVIMGLLVWIGGYTGFRLADLVRFRVFAEVQPGGRAT